MSYFLTTTPLQLNTAHTIQGDEAKHLLLSRRIKVGEEIEVQDAKDNRFVCIVEKVGKKSLEYLPTQKLVTPDEYSTHITLCQALIAEQTLDIVIQKATELGVQTIVIFPSDHSPNSFKPEKIDRWKKIAQEAAKQCGRVRPPQIILNTLTTLLKESLTHNTFYLSQHAELTLLRAQKNITKGGKVIILVGPEGGWSSTEQDDLSASHAAGLKLSQFVLRAETAAIAAVSQISLFIS